MSSDRSTASGVKRRIPSPETEAESDRAKRHCLPFTQNESLQNPRSPPPTQADTDVDSLRPADPFNQSQCAYRDSDHGELLCLGAVSNSI